MPALKQRRSAESGVKRAPAARRGAAETTRGVNIDDDSGARAEFIGNG